MFMEYRRELKVLFDNITQLVSPTVRSIREYYQLLCFGGASPLRAL